MSNGPAFAPDGTVAYFADTFARQILCFRLDASGRPLSQDTFATIPDSDGYPHGMTTDIAGTLYVGHWDGARINRWSPDSTALPPIFEAKRFRKPERSQATYRFWTRAPRPITLVVAERAKPRVLRP